MLISTLREPVEVLVVQDESEALRILFAVIGPALIASAAVVAAVVAARTANRRQQEQLNHDLAVRREEDIRGVLDMVVEHVHEMTKLVTSFELAVLRVEDERSKNDQKAPTKLDAARSKELQRRLDEAHERGVKAAEANVELTTNGIRLSLRLGEAHRITETHDELEALWDEQLDLIRTGLEGNRSAKELATASTKDEEVNFAFARFHKACENWIRGSHLN